VYRESPLIEYVYLHSDRDQRVLIAVVAPAAVTTPSAALREIRRIARESGLDELRRPKAVIISSYKWSATTGELSSTQNLVRGLLKKRFENEVSSAYSIFERNAARAAEIATAAKAAQYDWMTYEFVGTNDDDTAVLNELYSKVCVLTLRYRTLLQAFSQKMRLLEDAKRAERIEGIRVPGGPRRGEQAVRGAEVQTHAGVLRIGGAQRAI
jgi:hypothetical protein